MTANAVVHQIQVNGVIHGSVSLESTLAYWTAQSLQVDDGLPISMVVTNLFGLQSLAAPDVPFGSDTASILVNQIEPLSPANASFFLPITGIIGLASTEVELTVAGTLTLPGCVNKAQTFTFEFRPTDGSASITQSATLNTDGTFSLSNIPAKVYNLTIKGSKWLRKVVSVDTSGGSVSGVTATLLAGDINGDNQVSLADYVLLRSAFGSKPDSANWNANADLNCDGQVSLADYVILRNNFGKKGDP